MKYPILFPKEVSDFIEGTFDMTDKVFKSTMGYKKVGENLWEEILPESSNGFVMGVDAFRGDFEWMDNAKSTAVFKKDPSGQWVAAYQSRPFSQKEFEEDMRKAALYFGNNILCEECGEIGGHKKTCSQYPLDKKEVEKDWEVVAVKENYHPHRIHELQEDGNRKWINGQSYEWALLKVPITYSILSVRRSDGEIFRIGDEVVYAPVNKIRWVIQNFFINKDGKMLARSEGNIYCEFVDKNLKKLPSQSPPMQKSWEILAFKTEGKVWWKDPSGYFNDGNGVIPEEDFLKSNATIYSVRRLSDGMAFTVGQMVDVYYGERYKLNTPQMITGFKIKTGMIVLHEAGDSALHEIQKLLPHPSKERIDWDGIAETIMMFIKGNMPKEKISEFIEQQFEIIKFSIDGGILQPKKYSPTDIDEIKRRAFEAGRSRIGGAWNEPIKNWAYQGYSDYKNELPNYKKSKQS